MRRTIAALICGLPIALVPLSAHHSFFAMYFEEQSVTLEGVVQKFEYRSPHAILVFTSRDPDGLEQTFTAEWSNPSRLNREGVKKDTLKFGDVLMLAGSPGRVATERKLHLKGIHRPADGWRWGRI